MDEDELQRLIADLREMMIRNGFAWAAADAEDALYPTVASRTRALALISAAEAVTVDIAQVEMAADDAFDGEGIRFAPDGEGDGDQFAEAGLQRLDQMAASADAGDLNGSRRRGVIQDLAGRRAVFDALRSRLDGLD